MGDRIYRIYVPWVFDRDSQTQRVSTWSVEKSFLCLPFNEGDNLIDSQIGP
jgi:hypothetical protein